MKYIIQGLVMAACTLSVLTAPEALGQSLEGHYQFVAEGSADIAAAIEHSVGQMNFIKRPIARGRLKKTNTAYRTIEIGRSADQILIAFDGAKPIAMPAGGAMIKWRREDGEVFDVTGQWQAATIVQKFAAEDGERLNVFRLGEDGGTLKLEVTLTSEQLPAPLTYTLNYRRAQ